MPTNLFLQTILLLFHLTDPTKTVFVPLVKLAYMACYIHKTHAH